MNYLQYFIYFFGHTFFVFDFKKKKTRINRKKQKKTRKKWIKMNIITLLNS